jgi:hypothetical protein
MIFNFYSLDNLNILHITLILSKLEYASVVRKSFTLSDSNKLENMLRKHVNLC